MKTNIATVIVIYNSYIKESVAYQSLLNQNTDIYIYDNSTEQEYIESNSKEENYIGCGQNLGLSRAYNITISQLGSFYKYIMTSDSDTKYPLDYLEIFMSNRNSSAVAFIPDIYVKGQPKYPKKKISKYLNRIHSPEYSERGSDVKYFHTINSGTIYTSEFLMDNKFNERLFLEHIDNSMFDTIKKKKLLTTRIPSILYHDLSTSDFENVYIKGRALITYPDQIEYYGLLWYPMAFFCYMIFGITKLDSRYFKEFLNIYILRKYESISKRGVR